MKNLTRHALVFFLVLLFSPATLGITKDFREFDQKRNQLIGYILGKELPAFHFSHKQIDDAQSLKIVSLYLKQLDYQKRFLLSKDVTVLQTSAEHIADDLEQGNSVLPKTGYDIIKERTSWVAQKVERLLSNDFEVNSHDTYETDPKKIDYAANLKGLEDKWRKIIKEQTMSRYLELAQDQKKSGEKLPDDVLWKQAKETESRRTKEFFLRLNQETLQDHYDLYFNAIARSFDPHTEYLAPAQSEEVEIDMRGSLEGVGATLRNENGFYKVVKIIPGGPAAKQGMLQAEDIILQMAEKGSNPIDITEMRPGDAAHLIRGAKGTEVLLTVKKPDGTQKVIPIVRDVVQIEETFVKDTVIESPGGGKIGYILIPSFYRDFAKTRRGEDARNVTDDTRKAIRKLAENKLEGIILDLRNDGGGSLIDAIDLTGLFIESGPVVQVKGGNGHIQVLSDVDANIEYSGPLVVLVNRFSASAAEIVAAALQDYKRAIIVGGEHTFGKGTVQIARHLNENLRTSVTDEVGDLGVLKLTVNKFYRITGGSTQYRGFTPDIVLPSVLQHQQTGEKFLDYALPWDQVEPVGYASFSRTPFDLEMIRKRSLQRIQLDPEMQAIAKKAELAEERSRQTAVSLRLTALQQKIDAARTEQKSFSGQLQNPQSNVNADEQFSAAGGDGMKKDDAYSWQHKVQQDPYVKEGMNIIVDMKKQGHYM